MSNYSQSYGIMACVGSFSRSRMRKVGGTGEFIRGIGVYVAIFFDDGLSMSFEVPPVPPG